MKTRKLGPGDEGVAAEACLAFGGAGALDVAAALRRPELHFFIAEDAAGIAGWAYGHELVHPDGERTMLLYTLDVAPPAQRRGHGRALVTAFVENARSLGCTEVWVAADEGNGAAEATYRAAGGVRQALHAVLFSWPLGPGRHSGG
jgi:GNAT superfamily N-acetyltransferase